MFSNLCNQIKLFVPTFGIIIRLLFDFQLFWAKNKKENIVPNLVYLGLGYMKTPIVGHPRPNPSLINTKYSHIQNVALCVQF